MKKKVLSFKVEKERGKYVLYVYYPSRYDLDLVYRYKYRKSALRGARRYAKRNGYTEVKEV